MSSAGNRAIHMPSRPEADAADAPIRVLVVDDDRSVREGCALTLRVAGTDVTTAERGDEAIELVRRRRFHIVLLDLGLPGVPGIEILKAALAAHPDTIVIVMTGNANLESNLEALRAGT